jgi:hypothetical protein
MQHEARRNTVHDRPLYELAGAENTYDNPVEAVGSMYELAAGGKPVCRQGAM